jgi:NitT/TauT family transport system ATP-binding protein
VTAILELSDVGKEYVRRGARVQALADITFSVDQSAFVCVVGASGSGKSTLLSLVAGLQPPSTGEVRLAGARVTGPGPERGLVFQSGAVYPWRTVEQNVAFGLELVPISRAERRRRVAWYLAETGLTALRHALPKQLSGGQRQRVAIARALVNDPAVLLADEPTGALDSEGGVEILELFRRLHGDGQTILMVTHSADVAAGASRVVRMRDGRIVDDDDAPAAAEPVLSENA